MDFVWCGTRIDFDGDELHRPGENRKGSIRRIAEKYLGDDCLIEKLIGVNPRKKWRITSAYGEVIFSQHGLCDVIGESECFRRTLLMCSEMTGSVVVNGTSAFVTACAAHADDLGIVIIPEIYDEGEPLGMSLLVGGGTWLLLGLIWVCVGPSPEDLAKLTGIDLLGPGSIHDLLVVSALTMFGRIAQKLSWKFLDREWRFEGRRDGLVYRRTTPPAYGTSRFFKDRDRGNGE